MERLQKKARDLEEANLNPKPWVLQGEVRMEEEEEGGEGQGGGGKRATVDRTS